MKFLRITHDTFLKYRPDSSIEIMEDWGKPNNDYLRAVSKQQDIEIKFGVLDPDTKHYQIGLMKPFQDSNYLNWYCYADHAEIINQSNESDGDVGGTDGVDLNVPYKSQLDNLYEPYGTCNLTSAAMVCRFYGIEEKPDIQLEDEMFEYCESHGLDRHYPEHIAEVIRVFGAPRNLSDKFTYSASWDAVFNQLQAGHPGIIHGDFTRSGHIIVVTGFNKSRQSFYVNDPYGKCYGYGDYDTRISGHHQEYSFEMMDALCGPDGGVWYHFIQN